MNLEALLAENNRLADVRDMFGDSLKGGFLQEIARTTAGNFAWSEGIAQEALATRRRSRRNLVGAAARLVH